MDPYNNWDRERDSFEEDSSPGYGEGSSYAFSGHDRGGNRNTQQRRSSLSANNNSNNNTGDDYDFNIEGSDDDLDIDLSDDKKEKNKPRGKKIKKTEDRMSEILERNTGSAGQSSRSTMNQKEDADVMDSWQKEYENLMEGIGSNNNNDLNASNTSNISDSLSEAMALSPAGKGGLDSGGGVYGESDVADTSDSFELSEADLEVGVYAARRSKELTMERQRRTSLSAVSTMASRQNTIKGSLEGKDRTAAGGGDYGTTYASSNNRINNIDNNKGGGGDGMRVSTALSSIDRAEDMGLRASDSDSDLNININIGQGAYASRVNKTGDISRYNSNNNNSMQSGTYQDSSSGIGGSHDDTDDDTDDDKELLVSKDAEVGIGMRDITRDSSKDGAEDEYGDDFDDEFTEDYADHQEITNTGNDAVADPMLSSSASGPISPTEVARKKQVAAAVRRWSNPNLSADHLIGLAESAENDYGKTDVNKNEEDKNTTNNSSNNKGTEKDDSVIMGSIDGSIVQQSTSVLGGNKGEKVVEAHLQSKSQLEDSPPPPPPMGGDSLDELVSDSGKKKKPSTNLTPGNDANLNEGRDISELGDVVGFSAEDYQSNHDDETTNARPTLNILQTHNNRGSTSLLDASFDDTIQGTGTGSGMGVMRGHATEIDTDGGLAAIPITRQDTAYDGSSDYNDAQLEFTDTSNNRDTFKSNNNKSNNGKISITSGLSSSGIFPYSSRTEGQTHVEKQSRQRGSEGMGVGLGVEVNGESHRFANSNDIPGRNSNGHSQGGMSISADDLSRISDPPAFNSFKNSNNGTDDLRSSSLPPNKTQPAQPSEPPRGIPVDLAALGYNPDLTRATGRVQLKVDDDTSLDHNNNKGLPVREVANVEIPDWPGELPVTAPSAKELAAHLSMLHARQKAGRIKRSPNTRSNLQPKSKNTSKIPVVTTVAAPTAVEVSETATKPTTITTASTKSKSNIDQSSTKASANKSKGTTSTGTSSNIPQLPKSSVETRKSKPSPLRVDPNNNDITKVSAENITKRFKSLEKQMADLQNMQALVGRKDAKSPSRIVKASSKVAIRQAQEKVQAHSENNPNINRNKTDKIDKTKKTNKIHSKAGTRELSRSSSPAVNSSTNRNSWARTSADIHMGADGRVVSNSGNSLIEREKQWDEEAMDNVMRIVEESAALADKEKELRDRENAINIRESLMEAKTGSKLDDGNSNGMWLGGKSLELPPPPPPSDHVDAPSHNIASKLSVFDKTNQYESSSAMSMSERAEASKVFPKELLGDWQPREKALLLEIEQLKMKLVDVNRPVVPRSRDGSDNNKNNSSSKGERDHNTVGSGDADNAGVDEEGVQMYDKDAEIARLRGEVYQLERLCDGYQVENEKLVERVRELESTEKNEQQRLVKQTERLNIEINKLRNGADAGIIDSDTNTDVIVENDNDDTADEKDTHQVDHNTAQSKNRKSHIPLPRRSADTIRAELEADALVRNMKEQLGQEKLEHAQKIKEYESMIDKLRSENRQLIERHRFGGMEYDKAMKDVTTAVAAERREHDKETRELREKLAWYAENQELLDKAEDDKSQLRKTLLALRKELMRLKKNGGDMSGTLLDDTTINEDNNASFTSTTSNGNSRARGNNRQYNRNPSDIKRIKELEKTVEDLQECLQKRHPDSVSNLIRAAKASESIEAERRKQNKLVTDAQSEAENVKKEYEARLRGLRQEHESIKIRYEQRIRTISEELSSYKKGEGSNDGYHFNNTTTVAPSVGADGQSTSILENAQKRVHELELENDRLRQFYAKKVEELKKKSDMQMRAMKRGPMIAPTATPTTTTTTAGTTPTTGNEIDPISSFEIELNSNMDVISTSATTANNGHVGVDITQRVSIAALKAQYEERVSLLEKELITTATELGKNKAENVSINALIDTLKANLDSEKEQVVELNTKIENLESQLQSANNALKGGKGDSPRGMSGSSRKGNTLRSPSPSTPGSPTFDATPGLATSHYSNPDHASRMGGNMPMDGTDYHQSMIERDDLYIQQLNSMEHQIQVMESRFIRREQELEGIVEEAKAQAKMERARIIAIHEQELSEKDDQLVRFRGELETLVSALRSHSMNMTTAAHTLSTNDGAGASLKSVQIGSPISATATATAESLQQSANDADITLLNSRR